MSQNPDSLDELLARLTKSSEEATDPITYTSGPMAQPSDAVKPEDGALTQELNAEQASDQPLSVNKADGPEKLNDLPPAGEGTTEMSTSDQTPSQEPMPVPTEGECKSAAEQSYLNDLRKLASQHGIDKVMSAVAASLQDDFTKLAQFAGEIDGSIEFQKRANALNEDLCGIVELADTAADFFKRAADEAIEAGEGEAAVEGAAEGAPDAEGEDTGAAEPTEEDIAAALAEQGGMGEGMPAEAAVPAADPGAEQDIEALSQALIESGITPEELVALAQEAQGGTPEGDMAVKQASELCAEVNRRRNQTLSGRAPAFNQVGLVRKCAAFQENITALFNVVREKKCGGGKGK